MAWETSNGITRLSPLGLCRTELTLSYDDECEYETKVFNAFKDIVYCDKCGTEARRLTTSREKAVSDARDNWRKLGKKRRKKLDNDMMF